MKRLLLVAVLFVFVLPFRAIGEDSRESQLNKGLRNSDVLSYSLMEEARKNGKAGADSIAKAIRFSPDLPAGYFAKAKNSLSPSISGILDSVDAVVLGIDAYGRNFWWTFTVGSGLFLSLLVALTAGAAVVVILRLAPDLSLISHDLEETPSRAALLAGLLLLSFLGPLPFLGGALVLLGLYMRKTDRLVVYFFLALLLVSPLFGAAARSIAAVYSSGGFKAVVDVNEARGNAYAIATLAERRDFAGRFSYALALKREGRYDEAIAIFREILQTRRDPRVLVNLGNAFVGLNQLQDASAQYTEALSVRPLASAYYNLSQVSREMFDFPKGDEYFRKALAIDREAVVSFREVYGRNPNRFVVDETLSHKELRVAALAEAGTRLKSGEGRLGAFLVPPAALVLGVFFFLSGRRMKHRAYRCRRCDTVLCPQCEKRLIWGQMCHQCYGSLVKLDELEVKDRVTRLMSIYEHQRRRRTILKALSLVAPGASQIYGGKILVGIMLLLPFLFFLSVPFVCMHFEVGGTLYSHAFIYWAAAFLAAAVYGVAYLLTKRRIARGWL